MNIQSKRNKQIGISSSTKKDMEKSSLLKLAFQSSFSPLQLVSFSLESYICFILSLHFSFFSEKS